LEKRPVKEPRNPLSATDSLLSTFRFEEVKMETVS